MSNITKSKQRRNNGERVRTKYSKPQLKLFGPVGALTQGGSGPNSEGMMMAMPADRQVRV